MNKLDLIIPTYNRPKFLKRILEYYNYYEVSFNTIVVDSSSPVNKKQNKKIVSLYPKLKILYIDKFPEDLPSHKKYAEMVKYAKSKYCVFCPDDDFIVPNGIKKSVDFLEKNPDYSVAHGTYISFYLYKNLLGSKNFWWRFIYPYKSIESSNPAERLKLHLTNYYQVLWAVRRTAVVKLAYKEFLKSRVDPFLFGELLPDMLTLIFGKMKRLNIFYSARQAFSTSYSYWPSLMDAKNQGIYNKEYGKFKDCLTKNLNKTSQISIKETGVIVNSSMETYLKNTIQEHLTGRVNLILKNFPQFVSNVLRQLHTIYLFSKETKDEIGSINTHYSKYFRDFEAIRQSVLKHDI